MNMRRGAVAALLAVALVGAGSIAFAQSPASPSLAAAAEARERFRRGVELYDAGNYNAAMVEFQRAYELGRDPQLLYNISATLEGLGDFVGALDRLRQFVSTAPPRIVNERRAEIDASFVRLESRIGTVIVPLDVPELDVRIDGILTPRGQARTGVRVSAGRHRIELRSPGFESVELDVDVPGGAQVPVQPLLHHRQSAINVDANVADAEVLVDGVVVGRTLLASPLRVDEGMHHVEVRRAGYTTYSSEVNAIGPGAIVLASLAWANPVPTRAGARLHIRVSEPDTRATLDDQPIGFSGSERVPPGPHHLRVERPDFVSYERDLTLMPGRETTIDVRLVPTAEFRETYLSHAHQVHWIAAATGGVGLAALVGGAVALGVTVDDLSRLAMVARDPTGAGLAGAVTFVGFVLVVTGTAIFLTSPSLDRFDHPHWQSRVHPGPLGLAIDL